MSAWLARLHGPANAAGPALPDASSGSASVTGAAHSPGAVAPDPGWPGGGPLGRAGALRRRLTVEHLAVLVLALLVLVVHDAGYILSLSYWNDEDWVAVTTKFPLSRLLATTSSTPIAWSALVRVFTVSGTQSARLVPLAFAGAAVVVAYWFARRLDWPRRDVAVGAGLLAGIGMLLAPAMLVRDDLKQYTTDAFFAVLMLAVLSRLEREWSRRALLAMSVATWGGMLFSHTVAFMGAAAFAAACTVQLARRAWRRLAEAAMAGIGTAILMLAVYKAFDADAVMPALTYSPHFSGYYPPLHGGLSAIARFVISHVGAVEHTELGFAPLWLIALLFVAGVVTIFRHGRPATAIALAALWPEMFLIAALRLYPFLDSRTSTFLFAVTTVVAAIGAAGVCSLLRPWLNGAPATGLALLAVAGFAVATQPFARTHLIPDEGMQALVGYVHDYVPASEVVLVAQNSTYGFAYYWPAGKPSRVADSTTIQGYEAYYPGQPRIVVALSRDRAGVDAALVRALAQSRQRGCAPIWLIRTHNVPVEMAAYSAWLQQRHLSAVPAGPKGLTKVQLNDSVCQ